MNGNEAYPFSVDGIELNGTFYVDRNYTQKHAHTLHQHKSVMELLYVCDGEGRYQVGSREYAVSEGDMVICNAWTLHGETLSLKNTIQTYCIALSGVQLPGLPENCLIPSERRPVVSMTRFKEMADVMMPHIHDMFLLKETQLGRQLSISMLMMTYQELQLQQQESHNRLAQRNELMVREITKYLDAHYTESLRMEDICKEFHLSVSYLSHMFKKETGLSPKQYIVLRRIGEAQSLLSESDIPIGKIEEMLGFTSSCHLTSTFKKYVGISPREYRQHFREIEK
ncbi:AraC family transcriptional regulator [Butyricicoccus sp.]|uniref:AraC family transcriptional regulator n=1 Tax=Butyricicoccus sp. TaxID=2049021 RepID=UPI003F17711E